MANKYDYSYGIIPLKKRDHVWNVLLVQLHAGHWGFPKGHANPNETHLDTAKRELFEETGLTVSELLSNKTLEETYSFKSKGDFIHKKVIYFISLVQGEEKIMEEEVKAIQWVPLKEAVHYVTFDQAKHICLQTLQLIQ